MKTQIFVLTYFVNIASSVVLIGFSNFHLSHKKIPINLVSWKFKIVMHELNDLDTLKV